MQHLYVHETKAIAWALLASVAFIDYPLWREGYVNLAYLSAGMKLLCLMPLPLLYLRYGRASKRASLTLTIPVTEAVDLCLASLGEIPGSKVLRISQDSGTVEAEARQDKQVSRILYRVEPLLERFSRVAVFCYPVNPLIPVDFGWRNCHLLSKITRYLQLFPDFASPSTDVELYAVPRHNFCNGARTALATATLGISALGLLAAAIANAAYSLPSKPKSWPAPHPTIADSSRHRFTYVVASPSLLMAPKHRDPQVDYRIGKSSTRPRISRSSQVESTAKQLEMLAPTLSLRSHHSQIAPPSSPSQVEHEVNTDDLAQMDRMIKTEQTKLTFLCMKRAQTLASERGLPGLAQPGQWPPASAPFPGGRWYPTLPQVYLRPVTPMPITPIAVPSPAATYQPNPFVPMPYQNAGIYAGVPPAPPAAPETTNLGPSYTSEQPRVAPDCDANL